MKSPEDISEFAIVKGRRVQGSIYEPSTDPAVLARNSRLGGFNPDWHSIMRRPDIGAFAFVLAGSIGIAHLVGSKLPALYRRTQSKIISSFKN